MFKLLEELKEASVMIDEMTNELVERHRLPNELSKSVNVFRQDLGNLLFGIPIK
jgi:hypothetical protein